MAAPEIVTTEELLKPSSKIKPLMSNPDEDPRLVKAILYGEAANDPEGLSAKLNTYYKRKNETESTLTEVMKRSSSAYRNRSKQFLKAEKGVLGNPIEQRAYDHISNTVDNFIQDDNWNYKYHESPSFYKNDQEMVNSLKARWGNDADFSNMKKIGNEYYFPQKVKSQSVAPVKSVEDVQAVQGEPTEILMPEMTKNVLKDKFHPELSPLISELKKKADAKGIQFKITQGWRSPEEQMALYEQGRTKPGKIVTYKKSGEHNKGTAFDIVVIKNGKVSWDPKDYQEIGALGEEIGLEWGGSWKSFKDNPHFQLPRKKPIKKVVDNLSFLNPFNTPEASADEIPGSSPNGHAQSDGIFTTEELTGKTASPSVNTDIMTTEELTGEQMKSKGTLGQLADHVRSMGLDRKAYDADLSNQRKDIEAMSPELRKTVYGSDDVEEAFAKQKENSDRALAFGTSSLDKLLFGLPSLVGKKTGLDSGKAKEVQDEHKVATAVGEMSGNVGSLLTTGAALAATSLPKVAAKAGQEGAKYWAASTRFIPRAIMSSATFGADSALKETISQADKGKFDPIELGQKVMEDTALGGLIGTVGGLANVPVAVASATGIGFTHAKIKGADDVDAALNGATFGIFEFLGGFGRDARLRQEAIKYVRNSMADWAAKKNPNLDPKTAGALADRFIAETAQEAGGMATVLKSQENSVSYLESVNKRIQAAISRPVEPKGAVKTDLLESPQNAPGASTAKEVTPVSPEGGNIKPGEDLLGKNGIVGEGKTSLGEAKPKYERKAPAFYSQVGKVIDEKMPNAATPEMIKGILSDKNGVKAEELKWLGVDEFIAGKEKVTKKELQDFVAQNRVEIKEVEKGGKDTELKLLDTTAEDGMPMWVSNIGRIDVVIRQLPPTASKSGQFMASIGGVREYWHTFEEAKDWVNSKYTSELDGGTKFSLYQLPGGSNYRELLLTLPKKTLDISSADIKANDENWVVKLKDGTVETFPLSKADDKTEAFNYATKGNASLSDNFKSHHFDEPNILAHVRMNERTDADGKKVLFLEEVQSDWHQQGRKYGYTGEKAYGVRIVGGNGLRMRYPSRDLAEAKVKELNARPDVTVKYEVAEVERKGNSLVPDAPFKKTWHELAMKRMLRYAAENGYDRVAWTTGAQQAERYDLSKQVDSIEYEKDRLNKEVKIAVNKDGKRIDVKTFSIDNPSAIEAYIGKDIAKKIGESQELNGTLSGVDLRVGGEGMKGFYDQILPSFMNKYAKKWGGRVGSTKFRMLYEDIAVHSVDITPSMKQSVLGEGQSLFENKEEILAYGSEKEKQAAHEKTIKQISGIVPGDNRSYTVPGESRSIPNAGRDRPQSRFAKDFKKNGRIDIRGQEVKDTHAAAELASLFRTPFEEHFQVMFIGEGKVKAHQVLTSGEPDYVSMDSYARHLNAIVSSAKRLGVKEIYLAHNHPSGNPSPSDQDLKFTDKIEKSLAKYGVKVNAHVVTNGKEFAVINGKNFKLEQYAQEKATQQTRLSDKQIILPQTAASEARAFHQPGKTTVLFLDSKNRITSADHIRKSANVVEYVNQAINAYKATGAIVVVDLKDRPEGLDGLSSRVYDVIALGEDSYEHVDFISRHEYEVPAARIREDKPQYSRQSKDLVKELRDLLDSSDNAQLIENEGEFTRLSSGWPEFLKNKGYTRDQLNTIFEKALNDEKLTDNQTRILDGALANFRAMLGDNLNKINKEIANVSRELSESETKEVAQTFADESKNTQYDWDGNPIVPVPADKADQPAIGQEQPVQPVDDNPDYYGKGSKTRKFIKTVKKDEKTAPEVARQIQSKYGPIGNQQTLDEAKAIIEADYNKAVEMVEGPDKPSRVSNAVAQLLIDKAQNEGRFEDAIRLVERTAQKNTTPGQTIQALSMYARLTPTGILRLAEKVFKEARENTPGGQTNPKLKLDPKLAADLTKRATKLGQAPQWEMPSTPEAKNAIQFLIDSFYSLGVEGQNSLTPEVRNAMQIVFENFQKLGVDGENTPDKRNAMQIVFENLQKLGVDGENTPMGPGIQELLKIGHSYASRKKAIDTALMLKEIQKRVPSSVLSKISMTQTIAQLLNTKTMIRNFLGNAGLIPFENVADTIGAAIDVSASWFTGQRTMWLPNPRTQVMGFFQGMKEGTQEALLGIDLKKMSSKFELPKDGVFDSGVMGAFEKALTVSLSAVDRGFYQAAFNDSIRRQLASVGGGEPSPEMIEIAHGEGLYRTFQDKTALSTMFEGLKKALNVNKEWGLGDMVIKYAKTPANIISRGIEYSPFGFVDSAWQMVKPSILKKPFDQYRFVRSTSRALTGSVLQVGAGALLALIGIIHGKRNKDQDVARTQAQVGIKEYQVNASALKRFLLSGLNKEEAQLREGDTLISYDWMQPMAIGVAIGANMVVAKEKNKVDAFANMADRLFEAGETITEQPLLSGLKRMTNQRSLMQGVFETAKGIPASFVPTFLNQIRQVTDNVSRNADAPWWKETFGTRLMNRVPGLSNQLPANVTPLGRPREIYQGGSNNPFNVFLNPAFVAEYKPDPVSRMVLDIWKRSGENVQFPRGLSGNSVDVGKENVTLSAEQKFLYQTYIGEKTDVLFRSLANNENFMRSSDEQKAQDLQRWLTAINTAAKIEILGYEPKRVPKNVYHIMREIKIDQQKIKAISGSRGKETVSTEELMAR